MKKLGYLTLSLLLLLLAGGCGKPQTLGPEDFLYAFRCGALPDEQPASTSATYAGKDGTYHYLELRGGGPVQTFISDPSGVRKVRCRIDQLPPTFPSAFSPLRGEEGFEHGEETRKYVEEYLAAHKNDKAPTTTAPSRPPREQPESNQDDFRPD